MATTPTNIAALPPGIATPDRVESRLGTLNFTDGVPDAATAQKLFDELDYVHAVQAFINGYAGREPTGAAQRDSEPPASTTTSSLRDLGVDGRQVPVPDGQCRHLLSVGLSGPEQRAAGHRDPAGDAGHHSTTCGGTGSRDFGFPGADRGLGGKYLLLPPGYTGDVPEGGFCASSPGRTTSSFLGRAFLQNNDPKPVDDIVKKTLKIYPYVPGGEGSSIAQLPEGTRTARRLEHSRPAPRLSRARGGSMNTIPPTDYTYWEMLNEAVQTHPADAMDPEIAGQIAAIGIVKGKPFNPDARMKKILTEAPAVANAASRAVSIAPRPSDGFGLLRRRFTMGERIVRGWLRLPDPAAGGHEGRRQAVSQ